jgi:hypothetical protein
MDRSTLHQIKQWDASREGIPGEHWLTLGAGLLLFMTTRRSSSFLLKLGGSIVAGMLVARAAVGRDGLEKKPWLPI